MLRSRPSARRAAGARRTSPSFPVHRPEGRFRRPPRAGHDANINTRDRTRQARRLVPRETLLALLAILRRSGRSPRRLAAHRQPSCPGTRRTISTRCCAISARRWSTANCRSGTPTISAAIRPSPIPQSLLFTPTMLLFGWLVPPALDAAVRPRRLRALLPGALAFVPLFRRRGWHPAGAVDRGP